MEEIKDFEWNNYLWSSVSEESIETSLDLPLLDTTVPSPDDWLAPTDVFYTTTVLRDDDV